MAQTRERPLTKRGRETPCIRQVSVFVENRVGTLAGLMALFHYSGIRTLALTVIQGFDCAILRFIFNDTDIALRILTQSDFNYTICELVAVEVSADSHGDGLGSVCQALLSAEIDIHYVYALISRPDRRPGVVIHVDNAELASMVLAEEHFTLLDENDLK